LLGICSETFEIVQAEHADPSGLLTMGSQGIGKATAELFARHGCRVVVTDLDAKRADETTAEINAWAPGHAMAFAGDVTDETYPERIVAAVLAKFGKINHLVLNAGFTFDAMVHKMQDKPFDLMFNVHVRSPFRLIRAASEEMRKNNGEPRSIVFVSSTSGLHGNVGQFNYSGAKAAVIGMTKALCKEWGPLGVRVNCIAFGLVDTRLTRAKETGDAIEVAGEKVAVGVPSRLRAESSGYQGIPLRRAGQVEDAAGAMLFLCSPLSSYVSGIVLPVHGGYGI